MKGLTLRSSSLRHLVTQRQEKPRSSKSLSKRRLPRQKLRQASKQISKQKSKRRVVAQKLQKRQELQELRKLREQRIETIVAVNNQLAKKLKVKERQINKKLLAQKLKKSIGRIPLGEWVNTRIL